MALILGEFGQTIDEKRRLALPAALREGIDPETDGKAFILVLGAQRRLWLYPDLYYRRLANRIKRSPFPTREAEKLSLFFAMARYVKPDSQGRVVLPEASVQRAQIGEKVMLVGQHDHIVIWPAEQWERNLADRMATYEDALEEMNRQLGPEQDDSQPS